MQLIIRNLTKSFEQKAVLRGCSFDFESGKIYGLLGRNGAGKTTLFNCLSGTLPPEGGEALFAPQAAETRPLKYDDVAFVFTQPHLPEFMTGFEYLRYFLDINKDQIGAVDPAAAFASVDFALADAHKLIKDYSHGMQNKLQMLASLLLRPPVILLDEPLTSFDLVAAHQIKNQIKGLRQNHIVIFSTHILQLAKELCDELVILQNGLLRRVDEDLANPELENRIIAILEEESENV